MPELHKLTPPLGVLQDRGFRVALLTDGRMSGASGKVPAAIHVTPEAVDGGPIARIREGDIIRLDAIKGTLELLVDAADLAEREPVTVDLSDNEFGMKTMLLAILPHQMRSVMTAMTRPRKVQAAGTTASQRILLKID